LREENKKKKDLNESRKLREKRAKMGKSG